MMKSIRISLALSLGMLWACVAYGAPALQTEGDLNGDGVAERIRVTCNVQETAFVLSINGRTINGTLDDSIPELPTELRIIDIDTKDKCTEVVVKLAGASSEAHRLYRYDGQRISKLADLGIEISTPGTGFVYSSWYMPFWFRTEQYVLNTKTSHLDLVPQPFYYVGKDAEALRSIPIYQQPGSKSVVANLSPKSTVIVVLYDKGWYLIKTKTNLLGWVNESAITTENFDNLPWMG